MTTGVTSRSFFGTSTEQGLGVFFSPISKPNSQESLEQTEFLQDKNFLLFIQKIEHQLPGLNLSILKPDDTSLKEIAQGIRVWLRESSIIVGSIKILDLSHAELTQIPPEISLFTGAIFVNLSFNHLTAIGSNSFRGLSQLQCLYLDNNQIQHLAIDAFQGLNNLQVLCLRSNRIRHLGHATFQGLINLWKLNLSKNQIRFLGRATFQGLINLWELNLCKNQIQYLDNDTSRGLMNLRELRLQKNQISYLPPFKLLYKFPKSFGDNPFIKSTILREVGNIALALAVGLVWKNVFG